MRNGRALERSMTTRPGVRPQLITKRHRRAGNASRCAINGQVIHNEPELGKLTLAVKERELSFTAIVLYKDILNAHKWITPTNILGAKEVPIGGGPRAIRRPGALAKGVMDAKGFMRLLRVYF